MEATKELGRVIDSNEVSLVHLVRVIRKCGKAYGWRFTSPRACSS
jgi:hypothetical protein